MATKTAVYNKGRIPGQYDRGVFEFELGNIQRAIQPTVIRSLTAATTQAIDDRIVLCDATGAAFTYTLLSATLASPFPVTVKRLNGGANAVTIGGTVDGVVNPTLAAQYASKTLISDGSAWYFV